ncbi:MAG: sulfite exporter TauE/SafE family protein [Acetobacteraceae bacterium]
MGLVVAIAAVGVVLGIAIGAVGIGGVLLVPFLSLTLGIDVKRAIAAALLSYVPSCAVAVTLYARRGSIPWREAGLLCLAALPTAYLGARATQMAPAGLLEAAIGVLLLSGGIYALLPRQGVGTGLRSLAPTTLLGLGGGTGFISALTGAGGAFVLLPVLLLLDVPVLAAIGLGQAIALPIAGLASIANVAAGIMDLRLAVGLAATLTLGIAIGTPIAHAMPQLLLRRLLGSAVALAGLAMLLRTAARLL